jgi:hypothetical protein
MGFVFIKWLVALTCVASDVELLAGSSPYDVRVFYPALITSAEYCGI